MATSDEYALWSLTRGREALEIHTGTARPVASQALFCTVAFGEAWRRSVNPRPSTMWPSTDAELWTIRQPGALLSRIA